MSNVHDVFVYPPCINNLSLFFPGAPPNKKVCLEASQEVTSNLPQKGRNEMHNANNVSSDMPIAQKVNYPLNTKTELHQKPPEYSFSGNCQNPIGYEAKVGDQGLQKGLSPKNDSSENLSVKDLKRSHTPTSLDQPGPSTKNRGRKKSSSKIPLLNKSQGNITKYNLRSTRNRKIQLIECEGSDSDELFEITMGQIISGQQTADRTCTSDNRNARSSSSECSNIKEQGSTSQSQAQPLKPRNQKPQRGQYKGCRHKKTDLKVFVVVIPKQG